ncbi:APC family permease [Arthrobacter sp. ISL-5]|uniref:APC family permease n=1 Tax=Arthrobacter sp. ISL-5 TaxID=2819111 RepID=UPI001BE840CF|nr:APC family permease [Arthrobacter sp. ISL-5]MBT2554176.1 APC family permease [Arthrobacter sp. ISL-5]
MNVGSTSLGEESRRLAAGDTGLHGNMNVLEVMFTVIAYNGPAVVFMGFIPVAILMGNGLGTPALFLAAGLLVMLVASGLMKVSSALKRPGGFYAIITAGLGRGPGLAAGFAAIVTYFAALISVYALSGIALSDIVTTLFHGPELPWPIGGLTILTVVTVLGHYNIAFSAKALVIFLGLEMLLIATYVAAVLIRGGADGIGFESFDSANIFSGSLAIGALFAVGLFGGFEATVIFRDEVKDPDRTIPRATYGVVATIALMYAVTAFAFINAYGANTVMDVVTNDGVTAAGQSVREYVGDFAYAAATVLLFTSGFALCLASHNILARYVFNLGADGVLPSKLGVSHPRHVSPHRASLLVGIAALIVVVILFVTQVPRAGLYGYLAGIYSYGMLIMITLVSLAISVFLFRNLRKTVHAVAMLAAFVVIASILVFASFNFDVLSGMTGALGVTVLALIWLFVLSGTLIAARLKRTKPEVYARIGRQ